MRSPVTRYWRETALAAAMLLPLLFFLNGNPIPQDPGYHVFSDLRTCFGIPNFLNVTSNLAFLAVGAAGIRHLRAGAGDGAIRSWRVFFAAVALVALGSAYYHTAPGNDTLVWDRLPMTVAFMALFTALFSEHVARRFERTLLFFAIVSGVISVAWWYCMNDLRPYVWIQLAPFLAIGVVLTLYPRRYSHRSYLLFGLALYALAKAAEFHDREIYMVTRLWLSGHTVKHLLAAGSVLCVYLMLRRRSAIV